MEWIKYLHVCCALLSVSGFVLRVFLSLGASPLMQSRWLRTGPHLIDTILLFSGVYLALQWPAEALAPWLPYKIAALLLYIVLGMVAFRFGKTLVQRVFASLAAMCVVAYLIGVALKKTAWSWFV